MIPPGVVLLEEQGFGSENDRKCGKFIRSIFVIFRYKEFEKFALEKFALYKSVSQLEATFIA